MSNLLYSSHSTTIIGLDPGLKATGWGILAVKSRKVHCIDYGVIRPPVSLEIAEKLAFLYQHLKQILETYSPTQAVVEKIFLNTNPASTLTLGLARGIVLMTPASLHIPVAEYPSTVIKKAVTGNGHAGKSQMVHMITHILQLQKPLPTDGADALAASLCFLYHHKINAGG